MSTNAFQPRRRKRGFEVIQDVVDVTRMPKKDRRGWQLIERVKKIKIPGARKRAERRQAVAGID